ncbi:MAG: ABC transporter permease, partial [Aeromicrobium sp.]
MANAADLYQKPLSFLDGLGQQMLFYVRVFRAVPRTFVGYRKEIMRLLAEVTLGSGALAVIGGTIGVIA